MKASKKSEKLEVETIKLQPNISKTDGKQWWLEVGYHMNKKYSRIFTVNKAIEAFGSNFDHKRYSFSVGKSTQENVREVWESQK